MGNVCEEPLEAIWRRMERWFALPRCGCLAKEVCRSDAPAAATELPLDRARSESLCDACEGDGRIPGVYASYFRGQAPADRQANQR